MVVTCKNCDSSEIKFVKYKFKNGVVNIRQQCFSCGRLYVRNFKKDDFDLDNIPFMDDHLREKFYKDEEFKRELKINNYNKKIEIHSKGYDDYLRSNEWRKKRLIILKRDNFKCRCCDNKAEQVHHVTYSNLGNEKHIDLISVCRFCHSKIHKKDYQDVFLDGKLNSQFGKLKICKHEIYYNSFFFNGFQDKEINVNCKKCLRLEYQRVKEYLDFIKKTGNKL